MKRWAFVSGFSLLLLASLGGLAAWIRTYDLGNEISLPLLTIAGVMSLLGSLAVVAVAFSMMNMSDRTQALGLPNGSVRAVIALSLVVLFAILSVYLFSSIRESSAIKVAACLTQDESAAFQKKIPPSEFISSAENPTTPSGANCPQAGKATTYSVYYHDAGTTEGIDFAKQLLVLIGTLVTSVSGFYFGSKATADAQEISAGLDDPPTVRTAEPSSFAAGSQAAELTVFGKSLNSVHQVQLVSGEETITDGHAMSSPTQVTANFMIPPTFAGKCDVVVIDFLGRQARLAKAVEIQKGPDGTGADATRTSLTGIQPTSLKRGTSNTVTITGTNLAKATGLRFDGPTGSVYTAESSLQATPTTLTANVTIPAIAQDGSYTVTATGAAGDLGAFRASLKFVS